MDHVFTIVMIFRANGAAVPPTTCPTMVNMNEGGFVFAAIHRIAQPKAHKNPEAMI